MSGADFFFTKVDAKLEAKKARKFAPEGIEVKPEEIDRLLEDTNGSGKKLVAGLRRAVSQLDEIAQCGLTPEALVLLVTEKAPWPKSSKHKLTTTQIEAALKGLFALGEYLRQ